MSWTIEFDKRHGESKPTKGAPLKLGHSPRFKLSNVTKVPPCFRS